MSKKIDITEIHSYDQKKIGGTSVSVDQNEKIGSVRGNEYGTLDAFGLLGLPSWNGVSTEEVITNRRAVEPVFLDVTTVNSKEFPFLKPEGEPYLQKVGSQFKGRVPTPKFPTQSQGKFALRKDNPFNQESEFKNRVATSRFGGNDVIKKVSDKIERQSNDQFKPDDNDNFAKLISQIDDLANFKLIPAPTQSTATDSSFGLSNATERELNKEKALGPRNVFEGGLENQHIVDAIEFGRRDTFKPQGTSYYSKYGI